MQRVSWDLRAPAPTLPPPPNPEGENPFDEGPAGPLVMPGTYKVSLAKRVDGVISALGQAQEFQVIVEGQERRSPADRTNLVECQQKEARRQRPVQGAWATANALKPRLGAF